MFKKFGLAATFATAAMFTTTATAGFITDTVDQNVYLDAGLIGVDSHSYTHNINDDGFSLGSALSASLAINIYDDNEPTYFETWFGSFEIPDPEEGGLVIVENFDFDTGGPTDGESDFFSQLQFEALASLNADGFLDVTVTALTGDFYVGKSVLKVDVPEPGTMALLGLGLLGLGAARRRRTWDQ